MNEVKLYKTQKQKLKGLSKLEFQALRHLAHLSKNLYNSTLYSIRQYFFQEQKFLRYEENYHYCKENENYKLLGTDIAQQVMRVTDRNFRSFFNAMKEYKLTSSKFTGKPKLPKYLDKDGYFALIIPQRGRFKGGLYSIPTSREFKKQYGEIKVNFPNNINPKDIAEIRIHPKLNAKYFEIEYVYEVQEQTKLEPNNNSLALDFGINNLVSGITSSGTALLISGKPLKSVNQWYNKELARLQSIKDKQGIKGQTKQMFIKTEKRYRQINDYLNKIVRKIINFCLENKIGNLVVGYNIFWKQNSNIGKSNNQKFVQIPHSILRSKLEHKCNEYGINFIEQEESYTSKASFIDNDEIPVYKANNETIYKFSGKRIKRGLYQSKEGLLVNSDVNGAANTLRKSKQLFDYELLCRGCLTHPLSIKIA